MSRMRIVGGQFRGKRLSSPAVRSVRPTSERAREALFNILDHAGLIQDARFLDLFAGTGAVGIEAFSRGAGEVWLIDRDTTTANANVEALGRPAALHVRRLDATHLGSAPSRFDVAFLDPPYRSDLAGQALAGLEHGWLADDALVVVELAVKDKLDLPAGFNLEQERRYGAAKFLFLRPSGDESESEPS